jgi:hypothetical protein
MILASFLFFLGAWLRMGAVDLIRVGVPHAFEPVKDDGRFGVFRKVYKDGSDRVGYIIAPVPSLKAHDEPPSSVLAEFASEAEAIDTLARWHRDPLLTQPARRKKKQASNPAQGELALGDVKTRRPNS